MTDKQISKIQADGDLYRIRWYGYGGGVVFVLEKYNGDEWNEIERRDDGKGAPDTDAEERYQSLLIDQIKSIYNPDVSDEDVRYVDGRRILMQ